MAIGITEALGKAIGAISGGKGAVIDAAAWRPRRCGTVGANAKPAVVKGEAVLIFKLKAPAVIMVLEQN